MNKLFDIPTFADSKISHALAQDLKQGEETAVRWEASRTLDKEIGAIETQTDELIKACLDHYKAKVDAIWLQYAKDKALLIENRRTIIKALKKALPARPKPVPYFRKDYVQTLQTRLSDLLTLEQTSGETFNQSLQTPDDQKALDETFAQIYTARRTIKKLIGRVD